MNTRKAGPVTYSPSVTIALSHDCPWHCAYCGFRTDGEGLMRDEEIARIIAVGREAGASEALLITGEQPHRSRRLTAEARERGHPDFWSFVEAVAARCLEAGLHPHGNYGALEGGDWQRLRACHVSMGVMLENVDDLPEVAPEKRAAGRLAAIRAAGEARIPFTTGLLLGVGESRASRFRSLEALAALDASYGHLQEILLQPCVPNRGMRLKALRPVPTGEIIELIEFWRDIRPEVAVQVPPNLTPGLDDLWPWIDDLGGISPLRDEVNPTSPWETVAAYAARARRVGRDLRARLPVYDRFRTPAWLDPRFAALVIPPPPE